VRRPSGPLTLAALAIAVATCGSPPAEPALRPGGAAPDRTLATAPSEVASAPAAAVATTAAGDPAPPASTPELVEVRYRVEVRTPDPAAGDFPSTVLSVLADERGWQQAGFALVPDDDAPHLLVIAEGPEVDGLCLPYDTYGEYSCQNGPVVAFNAERWREATPQWTGDLGTYRMMLINHEVGHLLGQRHTDCPAPGEPAPVMTQQSTELDGCLPNPWPLPEEIRRAAQHDQPIAPAYGQ